jgi:hypothetical protein
MHGIKLMVMQLIYFLLYTFLCGRLLRVNDVDEFGLERCATNQEPVNVQLGSYTPTVKTITDTDPTSRKPTKLLAIRSGDTAAIDDSGLVCNSARDSLGEE